MTHETHTIKNGTRVRWTPRDGRVREGTVVMHLAAGALIAVAGDDGSRYLVEPDEAEVVDATK